MVAYEVYGWGLLIAAGWASGISSGLLGVGGGSVIVPALIVGLPMLGVHSSELAKIAMATSLVVMIPTSIAATQAHWSRGTVDWGLWGAMAPSIVGGGLIVSMLVPYLSPLLVTAVCILFALARPLLASWSGQDAPSATPVWLIQGATIGGRRG